MAKFEMIKHVMEILKEEGFTMINGISIEQFENQFKEPVTIAEFLGWEEETDYEMEDGSIYKIINNKIYYFNDSLKKWICSSAALNAYVDLRKMKKVAKERVKIYISGQITGVENYRINFDTAEKFLKNEFPKSKILNPSKITLSENSDKWEDYMIVCLQMLKDADVIYMLRGYEESSGAKIELEFAKRMGLKILFES